MECRHVELECGTIAVWERPGEGLPVVLIHGLGADAHTFAGAFEPDALPGRYLIAPDLPGHGQTPLGACTCTMGDFADMMLELLSTLGVDRYDLVCHSMGGAIGIALAERSGVLRFLNAEGNLTGDNCFFSGPTAAQELDQFMREGRVKLLGQVGRLASSGSTCWQYYAQALGRCDPAALHSSARGLVDASYHADLLERYVALPCRTCYVVGSQSAMDFPGKAVLAQAGCQVEVVVGGHFMLLDSPADFWSIARIFLHH